MIIKTSGFAYNFIKKGGCGWVEKCLTNYSEVTTSATHRSITNFIVVLNLVIVLLSSRLDFYFSFKMYLNFYKTFWLAYFSRKI